MFNALFKGVLAKDVEALANEHLQDARLKLLEAEAHLEYWQGMTEVLKKRVSRLSPQAPVTEEDHY